MITAQMSISTIYGDQLIPVEVLKKGPRPGTAWVRALGDLQPFLKFSPGGPFQDATAVVLIPYLRDVHFEEETAALTILEKESGDQRPADWFLEGLYEDRTYVE